MLIRSCLFHTDCESIGDSFSHPSGSSVSVAPLTRDQSPIRTERNRQVALAWFPPALSWAPFSYSLRPLLSNRIPHTPNTDSSISRKHSVPVRVHSVSKSCGSSRGADAQPVFDSRHGRITLKASLTAQNGSRKAAGSNQSAGLWCQPLYLAAGGSPKYSASHRSPPDGAITCQAALASLHASALVGQYGVGLGAPCGQTIAGCAHHTVWQSWPLPQTPSARYLFPHLRLFSPLLFSLLVRRASTARQ